MLLWSQLVFLLLLDSVVLMSVERRGRTEDRWSMSSHLHPHSNHGPGSPELEDQAEPYFNESVLTEIFAPVGGTSTIECRVGNLAEHAVSWIRGRDLHILTIGSITYTAAPRFTSLHSEDFSSWRLSIFPTLSTDTGTYECQISTEPKKSKLFYLQTTEAVSRIQGVKEVFLREGGAINLTCSTTGHLRPAEYISWWRGRELINTANRGGIAITTDKKRGWSNLVIHESRIHDSGNYTCQPSNSLMDSVQVHVLTRGDLAAFQTAAGLTGAQTRSNTSQYLAVLTILGLHLCSD